MEDEKMRLNAICEQKEIKNLIEVYGNRYLDDTGYTEIDEEDFFNWYYTYGHEI